MQDTITLIVYSIAAYFIGAIPFAYIAGRRAGVDIRTLGNGNVGTVNAFQSLGSRSGILVLLFDGLKGAAVIVAGRLLELSDLGLFAGALAATIGHNWSLYIGFKGGKGVAVVFGISIGMMPLLSWIAAPFVFGTYRLTKSWVWAFGAGIIALNLIIWLSGAPGEIVAFCAALSVLVTATHFGREAGEIRKAIALRQWRKVGQLE